MSEQHDWAALRRDVQACIDSFRASGKSGAVNWADLRFWLAYQVEEDGEACYVVTLTECSPSESNLRNHVCDQLLALGWQTEVRGEW